MHKLDPDSLVPLPPYDYQILLALADKQLHRFALLGECKADSEGAVDVGPSTLYPAMRRLELLGFIKCVREERGQGSSHDRRVYALTYRGRLVLEQETGRLRQAVFLAEHRLRQLAKIKP